MNRGQNRIDGNPGRRPRTALAKSDDYNPLGEALGVKGAPNGRVMSLGPKGGVLTKAEQKVLRSNGLEVEDTDIFRSSGIAVTGNAARIIEPPYSIIQLSALCQHNNTLLQCLTAMSVCCDGTGYDLERRDGEAVDGEDEQEKAAVKNLRDFLDEPYPGTTMTGLRRQLRYDLESTGNAYLEVIRDSAGSIAMLRRLDAKLTRLMKLDDTPTVVTRKVRRNGMDVEVQLVVRERRYAQLVGTQVVYFKEFGSKRRLDRNTGEWIGEPTDPSMSTRRTPRSTSLDPRDSVTDNRNPANRNVLDLPEPVVADPVASQVDATEVIHMTAIEDVLTPYGVPRWINQIPSVLGSREAETYNVEFFKKGGLPPVMVIVQNGTLEERSRKLINHYLTSKATDKQRGILLEFASTSGDLNSSGMVKVNVERFGAERQNDSMFEKYDQRCAERVLSAFRLSPLFVGQTANMNFATAYTSFMVAEAQVFKPERDEFDDLFNATIMREIAPEYLFRSKPVSFKDASQQITGLGSIKELVDADSLVDTMNSILGTEVKAKSKEDIMAEMMASMGGAMGEGPPGEEGEEPAGDNPFAGKQGEEDEEGATPGKKPPFEDGEGEPKKKVKSKSTAAGLSNRTPVKKSATIQVSDFTLSRMAEDFADHLSGTRVLSDDNVKALSVLVKGLSPTVRTLFSKYVGARVSSATPLGGEASELLMRAAAGLAEREEG